MRQPARARHTATPAPAAANSTSSVPGNRARSDESSDLSHEERRSCQTLAYDRRLAL